MLRQQQTLTNGMPRSSSSFISFISAAGDSTTPLPMMLVTFSRRIPDGIRWRTVFTVDYESMACVVTALVAYNIFSPFSQKESTIYLYLRHPLGTQYDDVVTHFKITVCLKMDSTIAFSELQHFLHSKMTSISLFLFSQSFSSTCSRPQRPQPQVHRQNDVKYYRANWSSQRSSSSMPSGKASALNLPVPKPGQAPASRIHSLSL